MIFPYVLPLFLVIINGVVIMRAFRLFAKVSDKGMLQLQLKAELRDRDVEIIVLPRESDNAPRPKAMDFVREWAGFLSDEDTDAARLANLREG